MGFSYICKVAGADASGVGGFKASSPFLVATAPGAPTNVYGTGQQISFDAPSDDGGSKILEYRVKCTSDDNSDFQSTIVSDCADTSCTATLNLIVGSTYQCTVTARNAIKVGPASAPSAPFLVIFPPAAPVAITVDTRAKRITWRDDPQSAPSDSYILLCVSQDDSAASLQIPVQDQFYMFKSADLSSGRNYACSVAGVNQAGVGSFASSDQFIWWTIPSPPINVYGSEDLLSWEAPVDNGGSSNLDYLVRCVPRDGSNAINAVQTCADVLCSFLLTTMQPGKPYSCAVAARNKAGTSDYVTALNDLVKCVELHCCSLFTFYEIHENRGVICIL